MLAPLRRSVLGATVTAALAALMLPGVVAASPTLRSHGPVWTLDPVSVSATGTRIGAFVWLRSPLASATWSFTGIPAQGAPVYLNLWLLVTNGPDGGSGHGGPVTGRLACRGKSHGFEVTMLNLFRPVTSAYTVDGTGYLAWGSRRIPGSWLAPDCTLTLHPASGSGIDVGVPAAPAGYRGMLGSIGAFLAGTGAVPRVTALSLPGAILGVHRGPAPDLWVALARSPGAGRGPDERIVEVSASGGTVTTLPAPYATGLMALDYGSLYSVGMTGTNYTNWRILLDRIVIASRKVRSREWSGVAAGAGAVATYGGSNPVWIGASEIGGAYGESYLVRYDPGSGAFHPVKVPTSAGGGVAALALSPGPHLWGLAPKSGQAFRYEPSNSAHPFLMVTLPVPTTPVALSGLVWTPSHHVFSLASWGGHVAFEDIDGHTGSATAVSAPTSFVSASGGPVLDGAMWTVAVTGAGMMGALGLESGQWHFVPVARATPGATYLLATSGPQALWIAQEGSGRLWRVPIAPWGATARG